MSLGLNFGVPQEFRPQRRASTLPVGEDYYANLEKDWMTQWQPKWDAATPVKNYYGPTQDEVMAQARQTALSALQPLEQQYKQYHFNANNYVNSVFDQGNDPWLIDDVLGAAWYHTAKNYQQPFTLDDSARQALEGERDRQQGIWGQERQTRQANQQNLQQGYNTTQVSPYTGGIINEAYSSPFPGATGVTDGGGFGGPVMPNGMAWGAPGYGQPGGGASVGAYNAGGLGGLGGYRPQQQNDMGGPFSNANPWAPSP